ncbi:MAG: hypothetical protein R2851_27200 [Caldilineaceae bacterium]
MIPEQEQAKPYQIDWFVDQLVRSGLYADPQSVWRSSLRALFEARPEEKRHMLASAYERGDVSLGADGRLARRDEGDPARIRRTFILALEH